MDKFASAKAHIAQLCDAWASDTHQNEATTRLRYIDTLLSDCLDWALTDIQTERYHQGDYSDYELGKPAPAVIVEAKRTDVAFTLPVGVEGRRSVQISTLMADDSTRVALEQVVGYCQRRGVPIGVIANGHQLAAVYASRQDGRSPLEGQAIVFSSLEEMRDDFGVLWSHLSSSGVAVRNLQRALSPGAGRPLPPPKLSTTVYNYPGFRSRSTMETDLKILGGLFIQDLADGAAITDEFVRECFVSTGAQSQYAMVSKEIVKARYSPVSDVAKVELEPVRGKKGNSPKLSSDLITAALSRRPIILLGDVGVGKSMFLQHFTRVDAADELKDTIVMRIDFGREPALVGDLAEHVSNSITAQISDQIQIDIYEDEFVRAVYRIELAGFARGIYKSLRNDDPPEYRKAELSELQRLIGNRNEHIRRSLEHIKASYRRQTLVILDNIDQRPENFQEQVFLMGQTIADAWPCTVFVSLRPSTFYQSQQYGTLNAYQLRVFTVLPTRTDSVIERRLAYARNQIQQSAEESAFPQNLSLTADDMLIYIDVLQDAFTRNDELNEVLDNLSGGNLRQALSFLSSFVGSGYVSTSRILQVARDGGRYKIPMHEFLRSIIFGEFDHFDSARSQIANLFDIYTDDAREHFLLPLLLAYAQRLGESGGLDGFVAVSELYAPLQAAGFTQEQIGPHLDHAIAKRLLETPLGRGSGGPMRITTVGSYMSVRMMRDFSYVDAMVIDTPIVDVGVRAALFDVSALSERLGRAEIFLRYLDECWAALSSHVADSGFDWQGHSAELRARMAAIGGR